MRATILSFALSLPLWAQIESLEDAKTFVDEVVADTDFTIPLEELETNIPFSNFRYPYVDENKNVLFVANDWFKGKTNYNHNGVYYSHHTGELEPLLKQGETLADEATVKSLLGLRTDFQSFVVHHGNNRGKHILARSLNGGPLSIIANQNTIAPGRNKKFKLFLYADIQDHWIAFNGTTPSEDSYWHHGLYLHSTKDQSLIDLIDNEGPLERFGCTLGNFSHQPEMDEDWLVFAANKLDPQQENCLPGRGILGWPMPQGDTATLDAKEHFSIDNLQVLAPFNMPIPMSGGAHLHFANNPSVSDNIIAVVGGFDSQDPFTQDPDYRCLLIRQPDGKWINPIDTDTLMPGKESKGSITKINQWIGNQAGNIIFQTEGANGYQAIYLYNVALKKLYFIIDSDTLVVGKKVSSFEVSGNPLVGKSLAFMARFEDENSGVYLAKLPGLTVSTKKAK